MHFSRENETKIVKITHSAGGGGRGPPPPLELGFFVNPTFTIITFLFPHIIFQNICDKLLSFYHSTVVCNDFEIF